MLCRIIPYNYHRLKAWVHLYSLIIRSCLHLATLAKVITCMSLVREHQCSRVTTQRLFMHIKF